MNIYQYGFFRSQRLWCGYMIAVTTVVYVSIVAAGVSITVIAVSVVGVACSLFLGGLQLGKRGFSKRKRLA